MGDPLSCERYGPEGDALQQTTTGLARYSKSANIPTFTRGQEHWALTDRGLVHWTGRGLDPPPDAADESQPTPVPGPPPPTPVPAPAAPAPAAGGDPGSTNWLEGALGLVRAYDRGHGTILYQALEQVRIVVFRQPGAWAAFVPSARTITLDPVLEREAPPAVATVLAHEAQHAVDWVLYGGIRSEVACYTYEISAFRLQAAMWQSLYGTGGKPDPATELENELNDILHYARTDAGRLISSIQSRYQDQCSS
jgi:hypothetical protein